jgi:hypothetical protein
VKVHFIAKSDVGNDWRSDKSSLRTDGLAAPSLAAAELLQPQRTLVPLWATNTLGVSVFSYSYGLSTLYVRNTITAYYSVVYQSQLLNPLPTLVYTLVLTPEAPVDVLDPIPPVYLSSHHSKGAAWRPFVLAQGTRQQAMR